MRQLSMKNPSVSPFGLPAPLSGEPRRLRRKREAKSLPYGRSRSHRLASNGAIPHTSGFFHLGRVRNSTRRFWKKVCISAADSSSITPPSTVG